MHFQKISLKNHKYDIFNLILLNILFILPMSGLDYTSYMSHDARWWLNQYYEYFNTFWNPNVVAFHGFNHTGLIINSAYPNLFLKIYETPLILLHIQNPYLVMGIQTMVIANILVLLYYILLKMIPMDQSSRFTLSIFFTSVMLLTGRGIVNSIPQLLATVFILIGVIGIVSEKKEWLLTISVIGLLGTSLTTSIIGLLTFALVFFIKPSIAKFKKLFGYSFLGLIAISYNLYSVVHTALQVQPPYQKGMNVFSTFFIQDLITGHGAIFITVGFFLFLVPLLFYKQQTINKYVATIILTYLIISSFPHFAAILMTPIQKGTFQRIWTIFAIIIVFWIVPVVSKKRNNIIIVSLSTTLLIMMSSMTYIYYPISHAVDTPFIKAYRHKNWDELYAIISTDMSLQDRSQQLLLKATTFDTAKISPDYIPKEATLKENIIAYTSPIKTFNKYGVIRHPLNSNTLSIKITPKANSTPLGVWHYNFIKYSVSTTQGRVIVKNGMYQYIGDKPATITIKSDKHD